MKVAVLVLVLANVAVFAWLRWADGSRHGADLVPLAKTGKKLTLLSETAAAPGPSTGSGAPARMATGAARTAPVVLAAPPTSAPPTTSVLKHVAGNTTICLIWPLASATAAGGLVARLGAGGYPARIFEREETVTAGYHVSLDEFADVTAAEHAATVLRRGGVSDLALLPSPGTRGPSLSIGVFSDRDDAEHRAARVRALGFDPRIRAATQTRKRHYLETRLPAAVSVSAALL
ncbi:MAG: hypothetical protein ACRESR_00240, partial [Gammaproteobacteria bacterium]